ncbi:MAG: Gx transporter family protein [Defluviitaleaceae bacterium]|nr:Gx transporter family protein [Defluviitaleaceae bacterium]
MLALIMVLVIIERMLPPLPMLPPQFGRLGLSNVIVMYVVFFVGKKEAITMAILKSIFNVLMRGGMAGLLSLTGGLLSVFMIIALSWLFKEKISYVALSIAGAIGHNIGQLVTACLIMQNWLLFIAYFPILLVAGAIFGTLTGIFLNIIMPIFNRINK